MSTKNGPKLLDEVRNVMRLRHYSIHTERSYSDWIKRFVKFHQMASREDMADGESKIETFLTDLAVNGNVAPSTQNQAMNALVFLYKHVLKLPLDQKINAVRARKKKNIPVVMTREETAKVISLMSGVPQMAAKLMYGSGLRIAEVIRLRVKDIDFDYKQITVRSGKGDKDRVTTFPETIAPFVQNHLKKVKMIHEKDLSEGYGRVYLPHALSRKYKNADMEWRWQYVFPSGNRSVDPRSQVVRRHHIDPSAINKAVKAAVRKADLTKRVTAHTFRHYAEFRTMPRSQI